MNQAQVKQAISEALAERDARRDAAGDDHTIVWVIILLLCFVLPFIFIPLVALYLIYVFCDSDFVLGAKYTTQLAIKNVKSMSKEQILTAVVNSFKDDTPKEPSPRILKSIAIGFVGFFALIAVCAILVAFF